MKAKKQRKITAVQVLALDKKLILLQHRSAQIAKQTTPLKITVRKYIQQNMAAIEAYIADGHPCGMIGWAVDKIKRGYFGTDTSLGNLRATIHALKKANLL